MGQIEDHRAAKLVRYEGWDRFRLLDCYWIKYLDRAWKLGIYGRYSSRLLVGTRLLGWDLCL